MLRSFTACFTKQLLFLLCLLYFSHTAHATSNPHFLTRPELINESSSNKPNTSDDLTSEEFNKLLQINSQQEHHSLPKIKKRCPTKKLSTLYDKLIFSFEDYEEGMILQDDPVKDFYKLKDIYEHMIRYEEMRNNTNDLDVYRRLLILAKLAPPDQFKEYSPLFYADKALNLAKKMGKKFEEKTVEVVQAHFTKGEALCRIGIFEYNEVLTQKKLTLAKEKIEKGIYELNKAIKIQSQLKSKVIDNKALWPIYAALGWAQYYLSLKNKADNNSRHSLSEAYKNMKIAAHHIKECYGNLIVQKRDQNNYTNERVIHPQFLHVDFIVFFRRYGQVCVDNRDICSGLLYLEMSYNLAFTLKLTKSCPGYSQFIRSIIALGNYYIIQKDAKNAYKLFSAGLTEVKNRKKNKKLLLKEKILLQEGVIQACTDAGEKITITENNMDTTYNAYKIGLKAAKTLLELVLEKYGTKKDHPYHRQAYSKIAYFQYKTENYKKALRSLSMAYLTAQKINKGKCNEDCLALLIDMIGLNIILKEYNFVISKSKEAFEICKKLYKGQPNINTYKLLNNLGVSFCYKGGIYSKKNDYTAIDYLKEAIKVGQLLQSKAQMIDITGSINTLKELAGRLEHKKTKSPKDKKYIQEIKLILSSISKKEKKG